MRDERSGSAGELEQSSELIWAPPNYPKFGPSDQCRFRILMNSRGWVVGLAWNSFQPGQPSSAGLTWNTQTKVVDGLWKYVSQCAGDGVDGSATFDAVVADTPGAFWSKEFLGTGVDLEKARRWMQHLHDDASWASGAKLPMRAKVWAWADPAIFEFQAAYQDTIEAKAHCLLALGPVVLLRDEGRWWEVPHSDPSVAPCTIIEVRSSFSQVYDKLGLDALSNKSLVRAYSPAWAGDLWVGVGEPRAGDDAELMFASNFHDEPLGLLLHRNGVEYLRGEGRWFRMPKGNLVTDEFNYVEVGVDFIPVWDELEASNGEVAWDSLARAVPGR